MATRWTGAAQLLYDIPAILVEYVRHEEPVLSTGWWRGVGVTHNNFVVESFIDELAAAAKQDPVAFRRALLGKSPRARAVLDLAAEKAGWGKPLPPRHGRGVSLLYSAWDTYLAQVAEVEVPTTGDVRVRRVVCAVDCGIVVNPDTVKAQMESGIIFGISGGAVGRDHAEERPGRAVQLPQLPGAADERDPVDRGAPGAERRDAGGIGEPGTAATAAALANAIFAATGKRLRKLPLRNPGATQA